MRLPVKSLAVSGSLLAALAAFEGFSPTAYRDIVGVWTIGFGTTENVRPGDTITPVQAIERKVRDLSAFQTLLGNCIRVPLAQHELDAYLSLAYNIGPAAFCGSTLVRRLNAGDYAGACDQILKWDYAGGRRIAGLTKRRQAEHAVCKGNA